MAWYSRTVSSIFTPTGTFWSAVELTDSTDFFYKMRSCCTVCFFFVPIPLSTPYKCASMALSMSKCSYTMQRVTRSFTKERVFEKTTPFHLRQKHFGFTVELHFCPTFSSLRKPFYWRIVIGFSSTRNEAATAFHLLLVLLLKESLKNDELS